MSDRRDFLPSEKEKILWEDLENARSNGYFDDLADWTIDDIRIDLRCYSSHFDGGDWDIGMEDGELMLGIQFWKENVIARNI